MADNLPNDALYVKLTIFKDRQVEFFGKARYIPKPQFNIGDPTSRYELWIDKTTGLPYKYRREMFHNISVETVIGPEFNKLNIKNFRAAIFFPAGYKIRQYGERKVDTANNDLLGTKAPDWILADAKGEKTGLHDIKSSRKLLIIRSEIQ